MISIKILRCRICALAGALSAAPHSAQQLDAFGNACYREGENSGRQKGNVLWASALNRAYRRPSDPCLLRGWAVLLSANGSAPNSHKSVSLYSFLPSAWWNSFWRKSHFTYENNLEFPQRDRRPMGTRLFFGISAMTRFLQSEGFSSKLLDATC